MRYTQSAEKFLLYNVWMRIILVNSCSKIAAASFALIIAPSICNNACIRNITQYTLDILHVNIASSSKVLFSRLTLNARKDHDYIVTYNLYDVTICRCNVRCMDA
jgi:hypothetical protein